MTERQARLDDIMISADSGPEELKKEQEYWQLSDETSGANGSGLTIRGSGFITCPNNVLADVDRLEELEENDL
ncbi:hypothetical protein CHS0354_027676, partial [Potamilus streckersoni]